MLKLWWRALFLAGIFSLSIVPVVLVEERVAAQVAIDERSPATVTGVLLNQTDSGIEVLLETSSSQPLSIVTSGYGRTYVANITNARLALPEGKSFRVRNQTGGIAVVSVTPQGNNGIRVTVIGSAGLPTAKVRQSNGRTIFSLTAPSTPTAQTPTPTPPPPELETPTQPEETAPEAEGETPTPQLPEQPDGAAPGDEEINIVVTGEQEDGYLVPDTNVGTRTDTPLRDIPQSIQVIPQQVLQDRQARSITDGLENVSGVTSISTAASSRDYFTIRGFEAYGALVNGLPDPQITSDSSFVNVERLEVLKGPASVLYGDSGLSGLGGTINFVTKQPLSDPFYEISATIGSFDDYQGTIDFSGPLNDSKTALYRFNAGYRSTESFIDFNQARRLSLAPNLSFSLGENTDLVVEGDVNILERNGQQPDGPPAVGTVLPNPNGEIRRSFSSKGPVTDNLTIAGRVGYSLEHQFNEDWKLRNAFRYVFYEDDDRDGAPDFGSTSLAADNRTLNREALIGSQFYDFYLLDTNLLGNFSTGPIDHQLLFGFSLSRNTTDLSYEFEIPAAPVDIFDPDYDNTVVPTGILSLDSFTTRDTLGIYLQDQITLAENLKFLLVVRQGNFARLNSDINAAFFDEHLWLENTNIHWLFVDYAVSPKRRFRKLTFLH